MLNWIITRDLVNDAKDSRVGVGQYDSHWKAKVMTLAAASNDRATVVKRLLEESMSDHTVNFCMEFRLVDGDAKVYFVGRCYDLGNAYEEDAFAPLDLFGVSYGCVSLEYRKLGAEKWEEL